MNRTEKAIIEAFLQLLDEKPYNKITVKNIAERCQVNRNTFYYHFKDIPDLLERIVKKRADNVISNYHSFDSSVDCIRPLFQYIADDKRRVLNIYRSVEKDIFLYNLEQLALYVVTEYINTVTSDMPFSDEDRRLLIRLYKCTLVGIVIDWLEYGMNYDLVKSFVRICELLSDSGNQALLNAQINN